MNIRQAFQIFSLDPNSSPEVIKKRYRELSSLWHPDLHASNSRSQALASEKMKEINAAYQAIRLHLQNHIAVACHHCGTKNRKPLNSNIDHATCSTCGERIKKPVPKTRRAPCGNARCAGAIGSNGRCDYCGKTVEAARNSSQISENAQTETAIPKDGQKKKIAVFGLALSVVFFSILYFGSKYRPQGQDAIVPASGSISRIGPHVPAPEPPGVFKPDLKLSMREESYYTNLFKPGRVTGEDVLKVQENLKGIGYGIKKPNGVVSDETIMCLKQYSMDFGYAPTDEDFPKCFFSHSSFHRQIATEHEDWLEIYLKKSLENWINEQPDEKQIRELPLGRAGTVIQLLRRYKFQKYRPLPSLDLPETGITRQNFAEGTGRLKVRTQTGNNNYYIKLVNLQDSRETLSAFIRGGNTLDVKAPLGIYALKYAAGHNWYGAECLFGTSASYGKMPAYIILAETDQGHGGTSVELVPSRHGKLLMESISEYDF
jgi:hypothetical protein